MQVLSPNHGALRQWARMTGGIELSEAGKHGEIPVNLYDGMMSYPEKLSDMARQGRTVVMEKLSPVEMGRRFDEAAG